MQEFTSDNIDNEFIINIHFRQNMYTHKKKNTGSSNSNTRNFVFHPIKLKQIKAALGDIF